MPQIEIPKATLKQQDYIEQLSVDLCFSRVQRNAHISSILGHEVKYLDELTLGDASNIIEVLKRWKEAQKAPLASERWED